MKKKDDEFREVRSQREEKEETSGRGGQTRRDEKRRGGPNRVCAGPDKTLGNVHIKHIESRSRGIKKVF